MVLISGRGHCDDDAKAVMTMLKLHAAPLDEGESESFLADAPRRSTALAYIVLLGALLLVGALALLFNGATRFAAKKPQDCAAISESDIRLSCYDSAVHRIPSQPARGANAPSVPF
jgi:hypothetical protein